MKGKTIEERLGSYSEIREEAQKLYATFSKVFCPALGQHVHFTSNGFNHLIYQSAKKERDKKTQILRFDMLKRAKFVLETSTTFQELEENSKAEFVSVIPAWFIKQYRDIKMIENSTGHGLLNDDDEEEALKNATQGDDL